MIGRTFARAAAPLLAALLASTPVLEARVQEPFTVDQATVDRVVAEVLPAVERQLGATLEPRVRVARQMEIAEVLKRENTPLMTAQLGDAEAGARSAGLFAINMSPMLLAKYALEEREILVNARNFEDMALRLDRDDVNTEACLRVVLVHELVHAADDDRHAFGAVLMGLTTSAQVASYSAVFEGHAQFVTRQVCEANGWLDSFERFVEVIGYIPEDQLAEMDGAARIVARVQASDARMGYVQGEEFIAAVHAAEGEAGVERAFSEPPDELALVMNPGWYLDPASRPRSEYHVEAALYYFRSRTSTAGWRHLRGAVQRPQLEAALYGLPEPLIKRALDGLQSTSSELAVTGGGERMALAVLYEAGSAEQAQFLVEINRRVSEYKDGQMTSVAAKLISASYEPLEFEGIDGFIAEKVIEFQGVEVPVKLTVLQAGSLVCEVTHSNTAVDAEGAVLMARQLLATCLGVDRPWDTHSFEGGGTPPRWGAQETSGTGTPAAWSVEPDAAAPSGEQVLRVVAANAGHTFNLFLSEETYPADVSLRVKLRADAGVEDQGGGLSWRAEDADNYYVTRWNPLEDNLRIYKVVAGVRTELQSAEVKLDPVAWHELRVEARGQRMTVWLDGEQQLEIEDDTFSDAGHVGLWTKADACVSFDELSVR